MTDGVAAVRIPQESATDTAPERPAEARGNALAMTAGITLIATAVLGVSNGELAIGNHPVRVVIIVGSLVALIFGISLCLLSRFARRRLPGALLGLWFIGALCLPYVLGGLLLEVPGFAVQVTFPGGNVVSTTALEAIVDDVRPAWHRPLHITLLIACVVMLVGAVGALASAARPRPAARTGAPAETPAAPVAPAGTAEAAPSDPWLPTRVDEPPTA